MMKHPKKAGFLIAIAIAVLLALLGTAYFSSDASGQHAPQGQGYQPVVSTNSQYKFTVEKNVAVPMRDGVKLAADIYRPAADGSFPVILARIPYGKSTPGVVMMVAKALAQRGAVCVLQDCRGRYNSEGVFTPFEDEVNDAADTLAWIRKQPWASKRIAFIGFSYLGYTAWASALANRGNADALVAITTTFSPYRMLYEKGVLNYMLALDWATTIDGKYNNPTTGLNWYEPVYAPLLQVDDRVHKNIDQFDQWANHNRLDTYWKRHDLAARQSEFNAPALFIGGWYDIFAKDNIDDFLSYTKNAKGRARESTLLVGPWSHALRQKEGEVDFGGQAGFQIIAQAMVSWLDSHLIHPEKMHNKKPKILLFVMGENRWREEGEWPLLRTRFKKMYFHSKGDADVSETRAALSWEKPTAEPFDAFQFNPKRPVPTVGGCVYPPKFAGPRDQRAVEQRKDVLVYTSEPLDQKLEITGPISVTLYASTSAKDTDFTAKLVAVDPGGRALNLQDGIVRARFAQSARQARPIVPGQIVKYTIDLWVTSYVFSKGQQIRVEISSSNFPRFDVNRNTGAFPATDDQYVIADQKIYHDAKHPSHITLPVIP